MTALINRLKNQKCLTNAIMVTAIPISSAYMFWSFLNWFSVKKGRAKKEETV
jgi:hypothetical protein